MEDDDGDGHLETIVAALASALRFTGLRLGGSGQAAWKTTQNPRKLSGLKMKQKCALMAPVYGLWQTPDELRITATAPLAAGSRGYQGQGLQIPAGVNRLRHSGTERDM